MPVPAQMHVQLPLGTQPRPEKTPWCLVGNGGMDPYSSTYRIPNNNPQKNRVAPHNPNRTSPSPKLLNPKLLNLLPFKPVKDPTPITLLPLNPFEDPAVHTLLFRSSQTQAALATIWQMQDSNVWIVLRFRVQGCAKTSISEKGSILEAWGDLVGLGFRYLCSFLRRILRMHVRIELFGTSC